MQLQLVNSRHVWGSNISKGKYLPNGTFCYALGLPLCGPVWEWTLDGSGIGFGSVAVRFVHVEGSCQVEMSTGVWLSGGECGSL